ncbi:hypothetical protein ACN08Y_03165 [Rothia sp. P5764]|uniref:hypothetical protein n=1 Tax=Rothia sp. P5764 TaxID=3402654 RepID=UPI003AC077E9
MWSIHEATQKIAHTRTLPYGSARTAAAEYIARTLENEGPEQVLPQALLTLVEAYVFGQPTPASFAVFSKLLRLWDSHPEYFDDETAKALFWQFKWVTGDLTAYPQISKEQARQLLDEMRKRYRLAGLGDSAADRAEHMWAAHIGDDEAAQTWQARWLSHGEDEMDCGSCRHGSNLRDHMAAGEFEQAVALGAPTEDLCNREPASSHRQLALALLHLGRGEEAGRELLRAQANSQHYDPDDVGVEFEILARGQQLERAFALLKKHGKRALALGGDPGDNRNFLRYLVAGLAWARQEKGQMPTGLSGFTPASSAGSQGGQSAEVSRATLGELYDWALAQSLPLVAAFDRRAGNTCFSESLADAELKSVLTPLILPEGQAASAPLGPKGESAGEPVSYTDSAQAGLMSPDTAAAGESADGLLAEGSYDRAAQAYLEQAISYEGAGQLAAAGQARAEAAICTKLVGREAEAAALLSQAFDLLVAGDAHPALLVETIRQWAPVAEILGDYGAVLPAAQVALDRVESALVPAQEGSEARPSGTGMSALPRPDLLVYLLAQELVARLDAAAGTSDPQQVQAGLVAAADAYAELGFPERSARLLVLVAEYARERGGVEGAVSAYQRARELFQGVGLVESATAALDACLDLLQTTGQGHRVEGLIEGLLTQDGQ